MQCDSRIHPAGGGFPIFLAILSLYAYKNSPPHVNPGSEEDKARCEQGDQVVADTVCNRFVESALVAIGPDVELEAFQLHALAVRHVVEKQRREVRLPGSRAQAGELRDLHTDQIVVARAWIGKTLKRFTRLGRHRGPGAKLEMVL